MGIMIAATASLGLAAAYAYYTQDLPSPDQLQNRQIFRSTKILDRNGRLLYELFDPQAGKRTSVKLSEISPYLIQATIAIEDATFYENQGISPRGILRALLANLQGGDPGCKHHHSTTDQDGAANAGSKHRAQSPRDDPGIPSQPAIHQGSSAGMVSERNPIRQ